MAEINDVMDKLEDVLEKLNEIKDEIDNLEMTIYFVCTMCQGVGTIIPSYDGDTPPASITCPSCSGAGKVALGSASEKD